eukprot:TRINITY_DN42_c0_g1_i1.p1 TRINITY_DN42_c0_g1~~TRINITY_DN42_c0_g1_i1.p1  ORF type:complete len:584 (+),score=129.84 TRINITY_DN42_c0_g1_i1:44-1795(+)
MALRGNYGKGAKGATPPHFAPPAGVKAAFMPAPVKQELGARVKADETDREAKIRARMEKIRAEAAGGAAAPAPAPAAAAPAAQGVKRKAPPGPADPKREEQDAIKLERMLPPLEEKVSAVEEEAERVAIVATPLAMDPTPELKDLQLTAVRETERAVKAAQATLATARRELEKRKAEASAFAPNAQESAMEEIGRLAAKLDEVQSKLDEHKSVRKDHEMAIAAQKLFGELAARITSIEIDCEKASMMAEPLSRALNSSPQDISHAEIRETKEALRLAQVVLAPTMRIITGKMTGLKGAMQTKMVDLQTRAEASQAMLDEAVKTLEEVQCQAAAVPILKQAADRMLKVEEVLENMRETEAPFLMGIEAFPGEEGSRLIEKMDKAASLAQSAVIDAHKYVSLKIMELGKLGDGVASSTNLELQKLKATLDDHLERVRQFQADSVKRKRANIVESIRSRVEVAEGAIEKLKEAEGKLKEASAADFKEIMEQSHAIELEAQNAVTAARRELQERQQDLRPIEGGQVDTLKSRSEILRTKVRVNIMEAELAKFKKLAKELCHPAVGKSFGKGAKGKGKGKSKGKVKGK